MMILGCVAEDQFPLQKQRATRPSRASTCGLGQGLPATVVGVRGIHQASLRMVAAIETGRFRLTEVNGISLADLDLDDFSGAAVPKVATAE